MLKFSSPDPNTLEHRIAKIHLFPLIGRVFVLTNKSEFHPAARVNRSVTLPIGQKLYRIRQAAGERMNRN